MKKLHDFRVLTFDCYGTLIDWEKGIWEAFGPLLRSNALEFDRQTTLQTFAETERHVQLAQPRTLYPGILEEVHVGVASKLNLKTTPALNEAFGRSVERWPAFLDSASSLERLQRRFRLVILSNVDRKSFAAANAKLGVEFDAIYTAEDVGSYKPSPANFEFLRKRIRADLAVEPDAVLHTAQSIFHDLVPADQAGLATAWIDRQGLADGGAWGATAPVPDFPEPDFRFTSLAAMADAVDAGAPSDFT